MKLNRIHAVIGLLLVLVPFMALSRNFKTGFSIVSGIVILYFAVNSIHIELRKKHRRPHRHDTFVESKPAPKESYVEEQIVEEPKQDVVIEKIEIIKPTSSPLPDTEEEPEL